MLEAGLRHVGSDAGRCLPDPFAHAAISVMVETVHATRTHTLVEHVAVPTLPNGGRPIIDGVEPARVLALEKQLIGNIDHTVLGEGRHQDGGAQEAGLQAVAVVGKVLTQTSDHVRFGLPLHQFILEREQGRCLHGVEDRCLEGAICLEEVVTQVLLCLLDHRLILGRIPTGCLRHVAHHAGINHPIAGTEVIPVNVGLRTKHILAVGIFHVDAASTTLQRLVAQPVCPLVIAILGTQCFVIIFGLVDVVDKLLHRGPVLIHDLGVAKLFPHHPRHDHTGISPT